MHYSIMDQMFANYTNALTAAERGHPSGFDFKGDPDDLSLRKIEKEVKIPQKVREKARAIMCADEVKAFNDCCLDNGIAMLFNCRKQNNVMKQCLIKWYNDKKLWEDCKQEYLEERAEFRRTGVPVHRYRRVHS